MAATWYRFEMHGRIPVTLFVLDGMNARAGGAGTKRFREELSNGHPDPQDLVRRAIALMPEVRRRWPWPDVPRPAGLRDDEREVTVEALLLAAGHEASEVPRLAARYRSSGRASPRRVATPRVEVIEPERSVVREFTVSVSEQRDAHRREGELVESFITHLRGIGVECSRLAVPLDQRKLYNDVFVPERNQLIEAKGTVRRENVRTAIGQIADYLFQISKDESFGQAPKPAILLPERPSRSISELLDHLEIGVFWSTHDDFEDNPGGTFTR
jgi:hypothetical protein